MTTPCCSATALRPQVCLNQSVVAVAVAAQQAQHGAGHCSPFSLLCLAKSLLESSATGMLLRPGHVLLLPLLSVAWAAVGGTTRALAAAAHTFDHGHTAAQRWLLSAIATEVPGGAAATSAGGSASGRGAGAATLGPELDGPYFFAALMWGKQYYCGGALIKKNVSLTGWAGGKQAGGQGGCPGNSCLALPLFPNPTHLSLTHPTLPCLPYPNLNTCRLF